MPGVLRFPNGQIALTDRLDVTHTFLPLILREVLAAWARLRKLGIGTGDPFMFVSWQQALARSVTCNICGETHLRVTLIIMIGVEEIIQIDF